ncbi:MAG: hypothetical protein WKF77_21565 [Planctomycetaceae bacterium]
MDSSRSGLLSTLLMTLPLIVVPAVALLRPPGQAGVSTVVLEAADAEDADSLFEDFPEFEADPAEAARTESPEILDSPLIDDHDLWSKPEGGIPEDVDKRDAEALRDGSPRALPPGGANRDPFLPEDGPQTPLPKKQPDPQPESERGSGPEPAEPNAGQIVEQLTAMGALKTMWFEAGDRTPVGFAVFFRGPQELTRFRFEAVGESREACARDVLEQVTRWQQQNPAP